MTICQKLFKQEQELECRRHSVYPLHDDSDLDFEFYVLVDTEDAGKRLLFLRILEQAITKPDAPLEGEPLQQFKEWAGTDDEGIATAINWIKIAIEQYPMRLFVVRNNLPSDTLNPFLKKRICWLTQEEFGKRLNGDIEQFKLWLYAQWVKHLIQDVRGWDRRLYIVVNNLSAPENVYYPCTLPQQITTLTNKGGSEKSDKTLFVVNPPDDSAIVAPVEALTNDALVVWLERHACVWDLMEKNEKKWTLTEQEFPIGLLTAYSENLSGVLTYYGKLLEMLAKPDDYPQKQSFLLSLCEAALLSIGVADERFQEWWESLDLRHAGWVFQQRVVALFWNAPKAYGQRDLPHHQIFAQCNLDQYNHDSSQPLVWGEGQGDGFAQLWKDDTEEGEPKRSLDVLIIHQGILDKWQADEAGRLYTREVLKWKDQFPFVVVTSGRGKPSNVPRGVRFLPFPSIEACIAGNYFEKLTLTRQIVSIKE